MGFSKYSPNRKYPPLSAEQKAELFSPPKVKEYEHELRRPVSHQVTIFSPKTSKPKLI